MYRITKAEGGVVVGCTDKPLYIKAKNGSYVKTTEEEAQGVAFRGVAYPFIGNEESIEGDAVVLSAFDGGEVVGITSAAEEKNRAHIDYLSMMSGIDLPEEEG